MNFWAILCSIFRTGIVVQQKKGLLGKTMEKPIVLLRNIDTDAPRFSFLFSRQKNFELFTLQKGYYQIWGSWVWFSHRNACPDAPRRLVTLLWIPKQADWDSTNNKEKKEEHHQSKWATFGENSTKNWEIWNWAHRNVKNWIWVIFLLFLATKSWPKKIHLIVVPNLEVSISIALVKNNNLKKLRLSSCFIDIPFIVLWKSCQKLCKRLWRIAGTKRKTNLQSLT